MTFSLPTPGLKIYCGGILAGVFSAGIFIYALTLPPVGCVMMDILAATPLFMAGLGGGVVIGVLAAIAAVIGVDAAKTFNLALYYLVFFALPASLLIWFALRHKDLSQGVRAWYSEGDLITATTLYPCLAFLAGEAATYWQSGGLLAVTLDAFKTYANDLHTLPADADKVGQFLRLLNLLAHMMPAIIGCGWIMVMLLSMFVSQRTMSEQKWNIRPNFDLTKIYLPKWLLPCLGLALLPAYAAPPPFNYIGGNLSGILIIPFFFQGLSIVHAQAARSKFNVGILVVFYALLLLPFPWTVLPIYACTILLGVTDFWFNFRARFARHNLETRRIR